MKPHLLRVYITALSWATIVSTAPSSYQQPISPLAGDEPFAPLPAGVPTKIKLTDKPADPAGKLVKLRYGPFTVPPNSIFSNYPELMGGAKIAKPCEECFIGAFQNALEFEDGTDAMANSGMYLHHFVIVNENKPDWLCGLRAGGLFRPQFIYNGGNERPPVRLNSKDKFGMRIDKEDRFNALGEIMNMSNKTQTVYTTIIYEVVPIDTPGYREATHLRIDGWMCGDNSELPTKKGHFQYHSANWTSPYAGKVLHVDGHGHDGVTDVKLYKNGQVVCDSLQYYGLRPGWVAKHHGEEVKYISDAVVCENQDRIEKGDVFMTEATYNDTEHPQMMFNGHTENVRTLLACSIILIVTANGNQLHLHGPRRTYSQRQTQVRITLGSASC
jgi:Stress up-regulated Nod 19